MNGINRLLMLKLENDAVGERMEQDAHRIDAIRGRAIEGTGPRAVTGFNLFQTPVPVAQRMAALVREKIGEGARVLEPSAGLGRLVDPLHELRLQWLMVEEAQECCKALMDAYKRADVLHRDFLTVSADDIGGTVDAVVMNPPFKQGRDIRHIQHALSMLRPGGRLVSLCYNGVRQNEVLRPMADHWEVLPEGSFKQEGTAASVALLVIDK